MKVVAIIQARMGSTRLPGKVMKPLMDKTVLAHVVERTKRARLINEIVVATTHLPQDDCIVNESMALEVKTYRGSVDDVLSRYYHAALENEADIVVRITSDCPLIDPDVTDKVIECYLNSQCNYASNILERTFPRGLDVEVFSFHALKTAFLNAVRAEEREHVTPYIYCHPEEFSLYSYKHRKDYSNYRWTLDTEEDWNLIQCIYQKLYPLNRKFTWNDVLRLMNQSPELMLLNSHVEQKSIQLERVR